MIYQAIKPNTVLNKLKKLNIPQATFAAVLDCSDTMVSLFLSGQRGLSYAMQEEVCDVLDFFDYLTEEYSVPVDFRQTDKIVAHWKVYKEKLDQNTVIRSARELERRAETKRAESA